MRAVYTKHGMQVAFIVEIQFELRFYVCFRYFKPMPAIRMKEQLTDSLDEKKNTCTLFISISIHIGIRNRIRICALSAGFFIFHFRIGSKIKFTFKMYFQAPPTFGCVHKYVVIT